MKSIVGSIIVISCLVLFFSCQKEYSLEQDKSVGIAKGSLKDSLGNCLPDSVYGTFYNGVTPGGDTAFVEIQVNVDSAGNYRIYTDLQNGFMFADSGFFNTTGLNTIRLRPIGTPILNMPTNFSAVFDTTACSFTVNVQDSTGTGLGGGGNPGGGTDTTNLSDTAWKFTANATTVLNGHFDSTAVVSNLGITYLLLAGTTPTTGDTAFLATILLPNGVIDSSLTYSTTTGSGIYLFEVGSQGTFIYQADQSTSGFVVDITISSYDTTTKIVTGTFSGTVKDSLGNAVTITDGTFKAKVN